MEVAILIAAAVGAALTAVALWLQLRWRHALLSIDFTRYGSTGPGSVVSLVVSNDGEAPVANLSAVGTLDGAELQPHAHQSETLGRDRSRQFDFTLSTIPPSELFEDPGRFVVELEWGRRMRKRRTVPFNTQVTIS
jgi:hypothetical protein